LGTAIGRAEERVVKAAMMANAVKCIVAGIGGNKQLDME
jgi:hypothetical protein